MADLFTIAFILTAINFLREQKILILKPIAHVPKNSKKV
jgi:hypothetical protein